LKAKAMSSSATTVSRVMPGVAVIPNSAATKPLAN
jgi:hypothetical protein